MKIFLFQYTDWEEVYNGYIYQKMVADVVGDYFFICPSIHFAQLFADRGMKVYYYFFTQVGNAFSPHVLLCHGGGDAASRETVADRYIYIYMYVKGTLLYYSLTFPRDEKSRGADNDNAALTWFPLFNEPRCCSF